MAKDNRIDNYEEFWAFYVGEHRSPVNRFLHYLGTSGGLGLMGLAIVTQSWWPAFVSPVVGYGHAWVGHFFIEGNKPASFSYPGWSFISDIRMLYLALMGQMASEVERLYGSKHPHPDAPCLVDVAPVSKNAGPSA